LQLKYYLNNIALPIICSFGILGNSLNLVILTRKRMLRKMDQMEKSGCIGLVALAMSDLLFCTVRIPHAFYPGDRAYTYRSFWLYYTIYRGALHNTFIMTGTWLTVTIATGRCIVVCLPLHARKAIMFTYVRATITAVFIISILFSLPRYFIYLLVEIDCKESGRLYMMETRWNTPNDNFLYVYRICWAFVGIIVPFIMLLTANTCLIRALHKSYKVRKASYVKASRGSSQGEWNSRLTHTLIGVVVLFFCLSAPAELLKFFKGLVESNVNNFYKYQIAMVITNFMQSCNSAINFILYYTINIPFRKTIRHLFWAQVTRKCPTAKRKLFKRCFAYTESPQRITADSAKSNTDSVKYGLTNETPENQYIIIVTSQPINMHGEIQMA
ncbi:unnamed protein product, partial [Owenia fusiformis]